MSGNDILSPFSIGHRRRWRSRSFSRNCFGSHAKSLPISQQGRNHGGCHRLRLRRRRRRSHIQPELSIASRSEQSAKSKIAACDFVARLSGSQRSVSRNRANVRSRDIAVIQSQTACLAAASQVVSCEQRSFRVWRSLRILSARSDLDGSVLVFRMLRLLPPKLNRNDADQNCRCCCGCSPALLPGSQSEPFAPFGNYSFPVRPDAGRCDSRGAVRFRLRQLHQPGKFNDVPPAGRASGQMRIEASARLRIERVFQVGVGSVCVKSQAGFDDRTAPRQVASQHRFKIQRRVVLFECHCFML